MITEFKNTGGLACGLFALLCVALGGLTFTRAADNPKPAAPDTGLPPAAAATPPNAVGGDPYFLTTQYKIIDAATPPAAAAMPPFLDTPSVTPPPKAGQDYGAEYVKESTLLGQLNEMDRADHPRFIQALSTTISDPILNSILEQELTQETRLAGFKRAGRVSDAPEVREEIAVIDDLKERIDQRANGIIAGMSLQVAALRAAANDGLRRVLPADRSSSQILEDWDHQRVMVKADYLEYSNILFNLQRLPTNQFGGALAMAYAHQSDPELNELASTLRVAKEKMVDVSQNYGPDMPLYKTVKKLLVDSEAAYQNKIDAVMAGIKTRVNEDKGLLQLIEQEEKTIKENVRKQEDEHRY
jgi:hypothetical protein